MLYMALQQHFYVFWTHSISSSEVSKNILWKPYNYALNDASAVNI